MPGAPWQRDVCRHRPSRIEHRASDKTDRSESNSFRRLVRKLFIHDQPFTGLPGYQSQSDDGPRGLLLSRQPLRWEKIVSCSGVAQIGDRHGMCFMENRMICA